jgi:plasmid stabilization system protein ParE
MKIRLLSPARQDILDAALFYDRQDPGLGLRFYRAVERAIDELVWQAGIHSRVGPRHMVKHVRTFPYAIYYHIEDGEIRVIAILDERRDPDLLTGRLQ